MGILKEANLKDFNLIIYLNKKFSIIRKFLTYYSFLIYLYVK